MTRDQLEHAIRAACDVAGDTEVIVFGSQAILGSYPDAPESLRASIEVDVQPKNYPANTGHCLEAHDLAASILVANREKLDTHHCGRHQQLTEAAQPKHGGYKMAPG